jgi:2-C-methyl-D-erythritol 4-phosphate cytidylyltransferase
MRASGKTVALVAAAGSGERLARDTPKALVPVAERPLIAWCIAALAECRAIEHVVIAVPEGHEREFDAVVALAGHGRGHGLEIEIVAGAPSRSGSVAQALAAAPSSDAVLVHDAARPLVTPDLIDRCVEQLGRFGCAGVVAATRATDTMKEADSGGHVLATLERTNLWAVQTPQVFRTDALRAALTGTGLERASDDAQLVEAMGGDVRIVEAPRENLKITTELDLRVAEMLLAARTGRA